MDLKEVQITNFRTCASLTLELTAYNPIVGYNNAGKSNLLKAIGWLLKHYALNESFFGDPNQPVEVVGIISNIGSGLGILPANQQSQIQPYIFNDSLTFRRRQDAPGTTLSLVKLEVLSATGTWVNNPTGFSNALGSLFPEPVYIKAMEDAGDDVGKFGAKNTIGLLLKNAIDAAISNNVPGVLALNSAIQAVGSQLNGPQRIAEVASLEANGSIQLSNYFSGHRISIDIPPPALNELIKSASVSIIDTSGNARPFGDYGHGTQRAVQMALIQLLAANVQSVAAQGSKTAILIDEPELYLHPQAIGRVRSALKSLANSGFQIFFTTHSPLLVDAEDAIDTAVLWRCATNGTQVRQRAKAALSGLSASQHKVDVLFSLKHSAQWLFCERPIIFEGKTERLTLPDVFRSVKGVSFSDVGIAVIESSGSGSALDIADLMRSLGYAPKVLVDLDFAFRAGVSKGLLPSTSAELAHCKSWLSANSSGGGFLLDTNGLPMKGGTVNPEKAFELMAAANPVQCAALHQHLLQHDIWLWSRGAIEAHLGIAKGNVTAAANFLAVAASAGNVNHAADPPSLVGLMNWI